MKNKILKKIIGLSVFLIVASCSFAIAQKAGGDELEQMKKRVADLETQITSMQVMIGSLESLVKQQRTPAVGQFNTQSSAAGDSGDSSGGAGSERLDTLETQIRALSAQIEQLTLQMQNGAQGGNQNQFNNAPRSGNGQRQGSAEVEDKPRLAALPSVKSDGNSAGGGNPAVMYDEAYGHLLRRDYPAAEQAFRNFLKQYKNDQLAGNAQYWLGETYFQQGEFRKAADSFLTGYSKYRSGPKAPDSLLKLALSLNKLGQKDAACTTFVELKKNFPEAPGHVMDRVAQETRRLKC